MWNHAIPTRFSRCELSKLLHRSKFGKKAYARRSRGITQIRKAGLNTERTAFSLFPPFPPVRKVFICVNLRQSAGNSGFGCGWPLWEIRGKIFPNVRIAQFREDFSARWLSASGSRPSTLDPRLWLRLRRASPDGLRKRLADQRPLHLTSHPVLPDTICRHCGADYDALAFSIRPGSVCRRTGHVSNYDFRPCKSILFTRLSARSVGRGARTSGRMRPRVFQAHSGGPKAGTCLASLPL